MAKEIEIKERMYKGIELYNSDEIASMCNISSGTFSNAKKDILDRCQDGVDYLFITKDVINGEPYIFEYDGDPIPTAFPIGNGNYQIRGLSQKTFGLRVTKGNSTLYFTNTGFDKAYEYFEKRYGEKYRELSGRTINPSNRKARAKHKTSATIPVVAVAETTDAPIEDGVRPEFKSIVERMIERKVSSSFGELPIPVWENRELVYSEKDQSEIYRFTSEVKKLKYEIEKIFGTEYNESNIGYILNYIRYH